MKKQASTNEKIDEAARKKIEDILDEEIEKADHGRPRLSSRRKTQASKQQG